MKTTTLSALLALGLLATTAAAACPTDEVDYYVAVAGQTVNCVRSIVSPDGQGEHVGNLVRTDVDVIDQDPWCLD